MGPCFFFAFFFSFAPSSMDCPYSSSSLSRQTSPQVVGRLGRDGVGLAAIKGGGGDNPSNTTTAIPPPDIPLPSLWSQLVLGWFVPLLDMGRDKSSLDPSDLMEGGGTGEGVGGGFPHTSLPPNFGTDVFTSEFERILEEKKIRVYC